MAPQRTAVAMKALAPVASKGMMIQGAKGPVPTVGSSMRQQFGLSKIQAQVKELLGVFNPKYIGFETRQLMLQDPTVAFGLAVLGGPIINGKWDIDSNDAKIEAFIRQIVADKYFELASGGFLSVPFGYQPIEKVWKVADVVVEVDDKSSGTVSSFKMPQAWVFDEFKALDPRTINMLIDPDKDKWAGFEQFPLTFNSSTQNAVPARIGTERSFLWSYRRQQAYGRLQGKPHLNTCYAPWWSKAATNLFCDRYFERKAEPNFKAHAPAVIEGPNGEKIDGALFMASVLSALKNGEAICLPGEMDEKGNRLVDVEFMQDDKRGDMFQQRFDYLDLQILKGLWIPDRAGSGSSKGGSGVGSGESSVHYEMLQKLIESVSIEWFKEVQEQVVNPAVLYNFGEQALQESKTRICSSGISDFHRDLLKTILNTMQNAEVALADGKVVRLMEYMDAVEMCEELGVPIKRADQLGPLAHKRIDPGPPDGSNPAGNPGDVNVKGKGGAKPGQNTKKDANQ